MYRLFWIAVAMLGVTFTACAEDDYYLEEDEVVIEHEIDSTIYKWRFEPYSKESWNEKIQQTKDLIKVCSQVPDLEGCESMRLIDYWINEEDDIYCLLAVVEEFISYNTPVFMDTVEETPEFEVYLESVLTLTYSEYHERFHKK